METTPKVTKLPCVYSSPCYSAESSPSEFTEEKGYSVLKSRKVWSFYQLCKSLEKDTDWKHRPALSASLRERLKRTRRSFTSPLSVAKRLCVDEEEDGQRASADPRGAVTVHGGEANRTPVKSGSESLSAAAPQPWRVSSEGPAAQLRKEVKEKTETLRRLKMVQMYRGKNDLTQLQTLIDKWRSCAQAALYELQSEVPIEGRKADLCELVDLFGLDDSILRFDRAEGDFTT